MKPRFHGRQRNWDYEKALRYNDRLDGTLYLSELSGPNGAHYHLWVDPGTTVKAIRQSLLPKFRGSFDVVSWSYDFIPRREET